MGRAWVAEVRLRVCLCGVDSIDIAAKVKKRSVHFNFQAVQFTLINNVTTTIRY